MSLEEPNLQEEQLMFTMECLKLESQLRSFLDGEEFSDRVWMSVIGCITNTILCRQDNPQAALDQYIESLKNMPLEKEKSTLQSSVKKLEDLLLVIKGLQSLEEGSEKDSLQEDQAPSK